MSRIKNTWTACLMIALSFGPAGFARAETVFAVTTDDILVCSRLGKIAGKMSTLKRKGVTENALTSAISESGVTLEVSQAISRTIFSFEADDPITYQSVMGALCLQDKLVPVQLSN